jgi:hypothetical protein
MEVDSTTGVITASGFNAMINKQHPVWARTARGAAEMLIDVDEGEIAVLEEGDLTVLTITGLPDDSVEAVRYHLLLVEGEDGLYRFEEGSWSQLCRAGRGHDDEFLIEPCV